MTLFQLILLLTAVILMVIFFKQLLSGNYPKRGIDYEADTPDDNIGGISNPQKIFSANKTEIDNETQETDRLSQLIEIAKESLDERNNIEAKKALLSALHYDENNTDILRMLGVAYMNMNDFANAKDIYLKILEINPNDDLAHSSLANALHKLKEDNEAIYEHQKAILLDPKYAPHYYNYANTLYDLGRIDDAIVNYKKAIELDPTLKEAQRAIEELNR